MLTNQEKVKEEDSIVCDNEVAALTFARTTAYASIKVSNSTTLTISKPKTKPKRKVRKPRKVTPSKPSFPSPPPHPLSKNFWSEINPRCSSPPTSPAKNDAYRSKFPNYPITEDDPMPGDLVMASAGDIGLKAYDMGLLKRNELVFGKAKCFTYLNKTIDGAEGGEPYVLKDLELMKIEWSIKPGDRINHPIDMTRLWVLRMPH